MPSRRFRRFARRNRTSIASKSPCRSLCATASGFASHRFQWFANAPVCLCAQLPPPPARAAAGRVPGGAVCCITHPPFFLFEPAAGRPLIRPRDEFTQKGCYARDAPPMAPSSLSAPHSQTGQTASWCTQNLQSVVLHQPARDENPPNRGGGRTQRRKEARIGAHEAKRPQSTILCGLCSPWKNFYKSVAIYGLYGIIMIA